MGSQRVGHDWATELTNWTEYSLCVCMYYVHTHTHTHTFIHSSVDRHLGCLHVLAIVNSAAMNIRMHVSLWFLVLSGYMPRSGIAISYGNSIFSFLRNLHTIFRSGYTNSHSHQQCRRLSCSPNSFEHLFFCRYFWWCPFWLTPFLIWNQSLIPRPVLNVASWPAYGFLKRQVRWSGRILKNFPQVVVIHTKVLS